MPAGIVVSDLSVRGARLLAVCEDKFVSLDLDAAGDDGVQYSTLEAPYGESRAARFIESLGTGADAHYLRVYGDVGSAALYESWIENGALETRRRADLDMSILEIDVSGEWVALATGEDRIYRWKKGDNSALQVLAHTAAISFIKLIGDDGTVRFGDDSGLLAQVLADGTVQGLGDFAFEPVAACDYRGNAPFLRGALSGSSDGTVWLEDEDGIYRAARGVPEGTVFWLDALTETIVAGSGNVLAGGTSPVTIDNLIATTRRTDGSWYLARFQNRAISPWALVGSGFNLSFTATLQVPRESDLTAAN